MSENNPGTDGHAKEDVNQRAFDVVARHLLTQGERSVDAASVMLDDPACLYRGSHGRKCAAGALISDAQYDPDLEGRSVAHEPVYRAIERSGFRGIDRTLLRELQMVHDDMAVPPSDWLTRLAKIAKSYRLSDAALLEFAAASEQSAELHTTTEASVSASEGN